MLKRASRLYRQQRSFTAHAHQKPRPRPCPQKKKPALAMPYVEPAALVGLFDNLFSQEQPSTIPQMVKESPILAAHLLERENARLTAESMARTPKPQLASQILALAHELGCRFVQNAYECVAHQYAEERHWHLIPPLISLGKQHTSRTTLRLMNWLTRARIERQDYASLQNTLAEFTHEQLKPNRRTYHLLVSGHIRNHDIARSRSVLEAMQTAGIPIDMSTYALIVTVYRSVGPDSQVQERAFEVLRDLDGRPATAVLNSLIQLRIDAHDFPGALKALALFDDPPAGPDPSGNTVVVAGNNERTGEHASPVFHADIATYSILMDYAAKHRDLARVFRMLNTMLAMNIEPGPGTIVSLIHAHFAVDDGYTPVVMVAELCGQSWELRNMFPFSSNSQMYKPVRPLTNIKPTVDIFHALLKGAIRMRGLPAARIVLRLMRDQGFKPDAVTIDILLSYLDKVEQARPRTLLQVLRTLSSPTVPPTLRHLHIILRSMMREEKYLILGSGWDVTAAKFSKTRADAAKYPVGRISGFAELFDPIAGIELPLKLSYRSLVKPLLKILTNKNIRSDRATIALRMRHDAVVKNDLESASNVMQTLIARGLHPNEYHYSALMEGYANSGELTAAEMIMASAVRAGIKPNVVMYTILIVGYGRKAQPTSAMRIFEKMIASGLTPDVPAIDAVASAFFTVGAYAMARKVLQSMWTYMQPFPAELRGAPLKTLARRFRALHYPSYARHRVYTKNERLLLHFKVVRLRSLWETWVGGHPRKKWVPSKVKARRKLYN